MPAITMYTIYAVDTADDFQTKEIAQVNGENGEVSGTKAENIKELLKSMEWKPGQPLDKRICGSYMWAAKRVQYLPA